MATNVGRRRQLFDPTTPRLVLAEGVEDARFLDALAKHLKLTGLEAKDYGGKDKLKPFLKGLVNSPGFRKVTFVLITRDADQHVVRARQSVEDAIRTVGLQTSTNNRTVKVFIFPNDRDPGVLEDICLQSVCEQPVMSCVDGLFECVRQVDRLPPEHRMSKAKVYAYLATREQPQRRVGEAAASGTWDFESEAFVLIRNALASS